MKRIYVSVLIYDIVALYIDLVQIVHPHTLTVLVVVLGLMFYAATRSNYENTEESIRLGILAAIVCFVLIGMVHFPDGPFVRPSKPVWRAALSLSVLYQLFLVFLLFLVRKGDHYYSLSLTLHRIKMMQDSL